MPTPQHSVTGHTIVSDACFRRPNSTISGRYVGPCGPSDGYTSSNDASSQLLSQVPGYDSASDHYESDRVRYYPSSQPTSVATVPSTIRRLSTRGSISHYYRPPTYEEASMIPSHSNRVIDNSSLASTAISAPIQPCDSEGCASETDSTVVGHNAHFNNYDRRTAQISREGIQSSDDSVTQGHIYASRYNANSSQEQSQDHLSNTGSRGAQIDTAISLGSVQSDHEVGHRPYVRSVDASKVMSFNGTQTPMATSTPSRRSAVLNARHIHAQTPYDAREKLNERFKISRNLPERENSIGMPASSLHSNIRASRTRPNVDVPPTVTNSRRYSSISTSRSPRSQMKKCGEDFTVYSTHSSPARSHAHGYSSGVSSSVQSSPGCGYFNTRRASSPALYTNAHKESYGERIVKEHGRARHSDNRGGYPEDSSSDSGEERDHDGDAYLSSEAHDEVSATHHHEDRTPHVHVPTSARHVSIRRHRPSSYHHHDHYSDPETSPEHHYHGQTRPQLVKVIETPKLRKKRVVYLASEDPPPEEIYYTESGSGLFTPRQASYGRRVVGVVGSRNKRSMNRSEGPGVRMAELRGGGRPRKVYVEQPSEPVKRVYIVEQESGSDLEQFDTIEVSKI